MDKKLKKEILEKFEKNEKEFCSFTWFDKDEWDNYEWSISVRVKGDTLAAAYHTPMHDQDIAIIAVPKGVTPTRAMYVFVEELLEREEKYEVAENLVQTSR